MKNYFITATDTDAGKTFVACALIKALVNAGHSVAAYKPIAAGCQQIGELLVNEDAQLLSEFANSQQTINNVNPIALVDAIAPHIAAARVNRQISLEEISEGYSQLLSLNAAFNITEGAGGWRLPLNINTIKVTADNTEDTSLNVKLNKPTFLSDFAIETKQDVILVVNMKLGCLNHAILTYQAIIADGLHCVAWIANCASQALMSNLDENIASLEKLLPIPKIAQLDFDHDLATSLHDKICIAATKIDLTLL